MALSLSDIWAVFCRRLLRRCVWISVMIFCDDLWLTEMWSFHNCCASLLHYILLWVNKTCHCTGWWKNLSPYQIKIKTYYIVLNTACISCLRIVLNALPDHPLCWNQCQNYRKHYVFFSGIWLIFYHLLLFYPYCSFRHIDSRWRHEWGLAKNI